MNPIPITPADLAVLLFGATVERNTHTDEANYHWLRRPGAPAVDMPHKIVPPHIAAEVIKSDPDGTFLHIQTVVAPDITYHVLWETRHWRESNERVMQTFHAAREHREAFFATKSRELAEASAHSARLSYMIRAITACGVPRIKATIYVEHSWRDAENEDAFRAKIQSIENLFNITGIYQEPNEHQTDAQETNQVEPGADQEETRDDNRHASAAGSEDRQVVDADRGVARDEGRPEQSAGIMDDGARSTDTDAIPGGADGVDVEGSQTDK